MRRLLPLLVLPLLAIAAPVPKDTAAAKMKKLFGEVADAKKGYDFALDGDKLVLTMAADAAKEWSELPPGVGQEITGDFEATVMLTLVPPKVKVENAGKRPYLWAGLAARGKDGRYALRGRMFSSLGRGGKAANADDWESALCHMEFAPGSDHATGGHAFGPTFCDCTNYGLRMRRVGNKLTYLESADGTTWKEWATVSCDLADTVRVGAVGQNTTNTECTATFSDFTVTPLKK